MLLRGFWGGRLAVLIGGWRVHVGDSGAKDPEPGDPPVLPDRSADARKTLAVDRGGGVGGGYHCLHLHH